MIVQTDRNVSLRSSKHYQNKGLENQNLKNVSLEEITIPVEAF